MIRDKEQEKMQIYIPSGIFILFSIVFIIIGKDSCKEKMISRDMIKWKYKFQTMDIKVISFSIDDKSIVCKSEDILRYWKEAKSIYLNREKAAPDKLYKKEDFILEHCGKYYTLLTNKDIDSIVYKFLPKDQYEEYFEGKLINKSRDFYRKRKYHRRYVKWLVGCK